MLMPPCCGPSSELVCYVNHMDPRADAGFFFSVLLDCSNEKMPFHMFGLQVLRSFLFLSFFYILLKTKQKTALLKLNFDTE